MSSWNKFWTWLEPIREEYLLVDIATELIVLVVGMFLFMGLIAVSYHVFQWVTQTYRRWENWAIKRIAARRLAAMSEEEKEALRNRIFVENLLDELKTRLEGKDK